MANIEFSIRHIISEYDQYIQNFIENGIAEPIERALSNRIFYLQHHRVYKESSSTIQLRVVYAYYLTENSHSLNGTNLLSDLLNFRLAFAVVAHIEKVFLRLMLNENDKDSHRFIWLSS